MEIQVYKVAGAWAFRIVAGNKAVVAASQRLYANKRNATASARLIAKSRIKVVVS